MNKTDITETIDNAISDYGVSPDAMRWAPEVPKLVAPVMPSIVALTPDQVGAVAAQIRAALQPVRQYLAQVGEALKDALITFGPLIDEMNGRQRSARSERLRHMRTDYRHKTRRRW